uniref:Macaca fascicularis brain cDNA, clone: QflA-16411 n=1 Tax=Macaca fascicularis TaxID=9541 RepID=I7GKZ5_MACFA|nr:unnamed protein product [Macaca fascicularis]
MFFYFFCSFFSLEVLCFSNTVQLYLHLLYWSSVFFSLSLLFFLHLYFTCNTLCQAYFNF